MTLSLPQGRENLKNPTPQQDTSPLSGLKNNPFAFLVQFVVQVTK